MSSRHQPLFRLLVMSTPRSNMQGGGMVPTQCCDGGRRDGTLNERPKLSKPGQNSGAFVGTISEEVGADDVRRCGHGRNGGVDSASCARAHANFKEAGSMWNTQSYFGLVMLVAAICLASGCGGTIHKGPFMYAMTPVGNEVNATWNCREVSTKNGLVAPVGARATDGSRLIVVDFIVIPSSTYEIDHQVANDVFISLSVASKSDSSRVAIGCERDKSLRRLPNVYASASAE